MPINKVGQKIMVLIPLHGYQLTGISQTIYFQWLFVKLEAREANWVTRVRCAAITLWQGHHWCIDPNRNGAPRITASPPRHFVISHSLKSNTCIRIVPSIPRTNCPWHSRKLLEYNRKTSYIINTDTGENKSFSCFLSLRKTHGQKQNVKNH